MKFLLALNSEEDRENNETVGPDKNNTVQITDNQDSVAQLDEAILKVMGEDPTTSKSIQLNIHPTLLKRWVFWILKGVPDTESEDLVRKYSSPIEFQTPKLKKPGLYTKWPKI